MNVILELLPSHFPFWVMLRFASIICWLSHLSIFIFCFQGNQPSVDMGDPFSSLASRIKLIMLSARTYYRVIHEESCLKNGLFWFNVGSYHSVPGGDVRGALKVTFLIKAGGSRAKVSSGLTHASDGWFLVKMNYRSQEAELQEMVAESRRQILQRYC